MTEREMEDLLWAYPQLFFQEPLRRHKRQSSSSVSRADLVFVDLQERLLVIEVKKGIFPRNGVPQILDHLGGVKNQHPGLDVEGMVAANLIPLERKSTLDRFHIEWREISERRFREVGAEKGYLFQSEKIQPVVDTPPITPATAPESNPAAPINGSSHCTDDWIKVEWTDANADSVADTIGKYEYWQNRGGDSFKPNSIHDILYKLLLDQKVHMASDLLAKAGGAPSDFKNKIKHVAHRGNCTGKWYICRTGDWKRVQLTLTSGK
jgi:hypothetical protein